MAHAVRMPKPGQMTEECVLSMWRVAEGQKVTKGAVIFEIETDKATMEVESFHDGVLLRQVFEAGATVPVNEICAWIGEPGEAVPDADAPSPPDGEGGGVGSSTDAPPVSAAAVPRETIARTPGSDGPAAGGSDMEAGTAGAPRVAISPRAQARAREADIDLRDVRGSGPDGRIVERDVVRAIEAAASPTGGDAGTPDSDDGNAPRPLGRMRRIIAERLTLSATTIPTFTATVAVDVTRALALREELRAEGITFSVNDLVLAATAQTLAEFPDVNSRTDGQSVWPRRRVHLGIAVALPDGLVVAVINDADRRSLLELHDEAARLVVAAREGTLPVDAMTGSTFTVSNLGMFAVDAFSAIINPGESGILAVASATPTPVAIGGGIAVRSIMKLTLTADHRLVDGELGARFLGALRRRLEDPTGLRSEVASG